MSTPSLTRLSLDTLGRALSLPFRHPAVAAVLLLPLLAFNLGHLAAGLFPLTPAEAFAKAPGLLAGLYGVKVVGLFLLMLGASRVALGVAGNPFTPARGGAAFLAVSVLAFPLALGGTALVARGVGLLAKGDALGAAFAPAGLVLMVGATVLHVAVALPPLLGRALPNPVWAVRRMGLSALGATLLPLLLALPFLVAHAGMTATLMRGTGEVTAATLALCVADSVAALFQALVGTVFFALFFRRLDAMPEGAPRQEAALAA